MKLISAREMMKRALTKENKNNMWYQACRWLMCWGVGAHFVALFLFVMAVT